MDKHFNRRRSKAIPGIVALLIILAPLSINARLIVQSQNPPPPVTGNGGNRNGGQSTEPAPTVMVSPDLDYQIAPGDLIEIKVEDAPELSVKAKIPSSGIFTMPYLGKVAVAHKTTEELSTLIADGLRGRYLKNPQVSVVVLQFNSQTFFVQGAVMRPGPYQLEGHPNLLQLIVIAGGLAPNHGSTAYIIREIKRAPDAKAETAPKKDPQTTNVAGSSGGEPDGMAKYDFIQANINGLLKGHLEQNVPVIPGDMITIPQTDVFFVAGEVKAAGSFPLQDGTTLQQAISLAQGTTFKAQSSKGLIHRQDPQTGKSMEIPVDIAAIMAGKKPDVAILANDVIIVPNSRFKSIGSILLTGLGTSAARIPAY